MKTIYGTKPTSRLFCEECGETRTETKDLGGYCEGHLKEHTPKVSSWEKEFDESFNLDFRNETLWVRHPIPSGWSKDKEHEDLEPIKSFIHHLLIKLTEGEIERLVGMKKSCGDPLKFRLSEDDIGYNSALSTLIEKKKLELSKITQ